MRKILIIGIGSGDPDQLTIQAIKALNRADVLFIPDKGTEKAGLRRARVEICERYIEKRPYRSVAFTMPRRARQTDDYPATVDAWHEDIATTYRRLILSELGPDDCGAFLVWGDPAFYDSTLRIIDRLKADGLDLDHEVIPGISSIQALAARHRVALNRIGEPVLITTGRRLADQLSTDIGSTVVMLDGEAALSRVVPDDVEIFWGANLGTDDEMLVAGRLADVGTEIEAALEKVRRTAGWVMDIYLLRRTDPEH